MAATAGYGGSVTFAGLTAGVKSWSMEQTGNMLESGGFDDAGVEVYTAGRTGFTITADVVWDSTNTVAVNDAASIGLQRASGSTVSGSVIVSNISDTVEVDGLVESTVSFQGTGSLPS